MIKSISTKSILQLMQSREMIVAMLLLWLIAASGCENQVATKRGSVNGRVTDTLFNPVVGAMITSHRSLFKAETDKNGHYEFTSLDVGTHRLSVDRNGYYLASKTVEIAYGEVVEGINIVVEPLGQMITHAVAVRESSRAVIDVSCKEPMIVLIGWRERSGARIQLPPTELKSKHQIALTSLFPGSDYLFDLQGTTADGRRYLSEQGSFKTVPVGDLPGAPDTVASLKVTQGSLGPVLNWNYAGVDPVSGFKLFRAENDGTLTLIQNENNIFAAQTSFIDEAVIPGRIYRYGMQAVDLDGNVSSMSATVSIMPGGKISENLVWKRAWSPISVNGDLIIPAGRTLTIEAGCVVRFAAEDNGRSGFRPTICELTVEGTLLVEGTADAPVRFISASAVPTRTDWDGLRIIAARDQQASILQHVEISGAERGLTIYNAPVTVTDISARFCQTGFSMQGASGTSLVNLSFEDCGTGMTVENSWYCTVADFSVRNCDDGVVLAGNSYISVARFDIRNIDGTALRVEDSRSPKLRNGLIQSFQTGLISGADAGDLQYLTIDAANGVVVGSAALPSLKNCIIVNRRFAGTGYGIEDKRGGSGRSYTFNNIYGFSQATQNCDQLGAPVYNLDPAFVGGSSEDYDYRLRSDSPILSASDKNGQPGAYGSDS